MLFFLEIKKSYTNNGNPYDYEGYNINEKI